MKKKMKRFNGEEGSEIEFESKTGRNENIGDDTRARARKFVEDKEESIAPKAKSKPSLPTVKASSSKPAAPTPTPKAESKPKPETKEEYTTRMEDLTKKQALERVEPENYVPGAGMLKGMFKNAVRAGERQVVGKASAKPAETIAKNTRRSEEGFSPEESLKELKPVREAAETASLKKEATAVKKRIAENDVAEKRLRTRNKNNEDSESVRERAGKLGLKAGGAVRMSASKRADGCAIRGKTRA
jgi:hypothetical protein